MKTDLDLAESIWSGRPPLPCNPVMILDDDCAGEEIGSKLERLREEVREKGASAYIDSRLDAIMWLLNLRGADVECNPVALCHILADERNVYLFIQEGEITGELRAYAALHRISLLPYEDFESFLSVYDYKGNVLYSPDSLSYGVYQAASEAVLKTKAGYRLISARSPLEKFKCVKNATELANLRGCYKRDSAALCRFIKWVTEETASGSKDRGPLTESSAAAYLDHLRSELPGYEGLSFSTISAYGPNAAMMHYTAVPGVSDADSNLQLMGAVFMDGCTGMNLDILAREPMWKEGLDYKCGTGHGIGYFPERARVPAVHPLASVPRKARRAARAGHDRLRRARRLPRGGVRDPDRDDPRSCTAQGE